MLLISDASFFYDETIDFMRIRLFKKNSFPMRKHIIRRYVWPIGVVVLLALSLFLLVRLSQQTQTLEERADESALFAYTQQFKDAFTTYAASRQTNDLTQLVTIATLRKNEMLKVVESDPRQVLQNVLSESVVRELPQEVLSVVEKEVELEGILENVHLDQFADRESQTELFLINHSVRYKLIMTNKLEYPTGSKIKVRGILIDHYLVSESDTPTTRFEVSVSETPHITTAGEFKTLVMLVDFHNIIGNYPVTKAQVSDLVFSDGFTVSSYYQETSFGEVFFTGEVIDWFDIPYDNTDCYTNYWVWSEAADEQATSQGYDLGAYQRRVYVFSRGDGCPGGIGEIGGSPSRSWIFYNQDHPGIYTHEQGHNFGLHHANYLDCGDQAIADYQNCANIESGDSYDVLGSAYFMYQFNGPHKAGVGWVPESRVIAATQNGVYTIGYLEEATSSAQLITLEKKDTGEFYYISYRKPKGFDGTLPTLLVKGASIHIWNGDPYTQTKFVNTHPRMYGEEALKDGEVFFDPINQVSIKQVSHNAISVTVEINTTAVPLPSNSPTPSPIVTTFLPSHDSYTSKSSPDTVYGIRKNLVADASPERRMYLKYTVKNISGKITKAKLKLHATDVSDYGGDVYLADSNKWKETTITWNNQPSVAPTLFDSVGAVEGDKTYIWNVKKAVTGNGTYSFVITSGSRNNAVFSSKEATSNQPVLEVSYQPGVNANQLEDESQNESD